MKGVDLKLGLDLVDVAGNRAASVAFLMSEDDDLAEAVINDTQATLSNYGSCVDIQVPGDSIRSAKNILLPATTR